MSSNIFENQLALIQDNEIRSFTQLVVEAAPSYIFDDAPSSSSGKYHPEDELGGDGCIVHTKRVVRMVELLVEGMRNFDRKDEAIAAAIIHDLRKQGVEKSGHTVPDHGDLAAALVMETAVNNPGSISDESFELIYEAVGMHYGPWAVGEWKTEDFHAEADVFCRLVHTADYLASRKYIGSKIRV